MSFRCPSALLPGLLATLLAPGANAVEPDVPTRVDPSFGPRIADAVTDAAERLDTRPCALVLSDFIDTRSGLTLAKTLTATGLTASEHVKALWFRAPRALHPRPGKRVFAYTAPRSSVVYLCRDDLLRIQVQRRIVTAIVIHEVLHTLGLREDFPSSVAITERVLARCF
jgi:hypothetical protein